MKKEYPHVDLKTLRFAVYSSADIRKLSVAKIVTDLVFDPLGHALPGGLYDPAMGPFCRSADPCSTCGKTGQCPGHNGHIELCALVYNPVFIKTVYEILRVVCLHCFRLQLSENVISIVELQLKLIDKGYTTEAQELEIFKMESYSDFFPSADKIDLKERKIKEYIELCNRESDEQVYNTKNTEALRAAIIHSTMKYTASAACMHCKAPMKKIKYSYKKLVVSVSKAEMQQFYEENRDATEEQISNAKSTIKAILADETRNYLRKAYELNEDCFSLLYPMLQYCSQNQKSPMDIFFCDVLTVTPPSTRPASRFNNQIVEHPQTSVFKSAVQANAMLRTIMLNMKQVEISDENSDDPNVNDLDVDAVSKSVAAHSKSVYDSAEGNTPYEKMYNAWQKLQFAVDQTWDMSNTNYNNDVRGIGLKQIIEKKEGLIRMHMMGKRVNYAARTVITPDPYINVDEIGIPDVFAKKLSYPVPVTSWNASELRKMVINGPDVHPGANFIEDENGVMTIIPINAPTKRESLAKTLLTPNSNGIKTVHRHLLNGDLLLLNRQPSLHRNSIMGHKARILKGEKTFRLHYSNCKSYNADFDGDEMNAHFPQNELGRSEGYNLANVSNQYLVPKDGTPLGGLIQDHVIAGVKISVRGRFFNREDYQQMVFSALAQCKGDIKLLPPAILKPVQLWSGKQVFSTILINTIPKGIDAINLRSTSKIDVKAWQKEPSRDWLAGGRQITGINMTEAQVIIRKGEFMVGVLDKTHYGATPYGLIHCMYELYGGTCSTQLLSSFTKLFTVFLQREGFTLGVHDILVLSDAEKKRRKIIRKSRLIGHATTATALGLPLNCSEEELSEKVSEAYIRDPKFRTILDRTYKSALDSYTNTINKTCLPAGLLCKFPENNLQLMVTSGAKGSTVNTMQISCLLGQIELEGKRPPLMISGKSLPSFSTSETSPKSGGFIDGRFMTGIQPQDFFFHCMAGREGLIDTAVKTSRSGYLQRCLIKHLEGLNVNYDMTVRDSDNSVIQFMYGEDGMDISKAPFISPNRLDFLDNNASIIINDDLLNNLQNDEIIDEQIHAHKKSLKSWLKKNRSANTKKHLSSFQLFSADVVKEIDVKKPTKLNKKTGRQRITEKILNIWNLAEEDKKIQYIKKAARCPDPLISKCKPDNCYGSVSEYFEKLIAGYVKDKPERKEDFTRVMHVKSLTSFAAPGEPVGLLAAQSIGEPSTQMTLNTFHFAGRGEMNVTLGIPRLREILMMASSNIKTPSMDIPFVQQPNIVEKAEKLRLKMVRVTVAEVLESINVKSHIELIPARESVIKLRFNFLPKECYKDDFGVKPKQIIKYMEKTFFKLMFRGILKATNKKNTIFDIDENTKKKKVKDSEDDELDDRAPDTNKERAPADSSDDEAMNDEDDATDVKLKSKNMDEKDYDEAAEKEELDDAESDDDNEINDDVNGDEENDAEDELDVLKEHTLAKNYDYDREKYLWCHIVFNLPVSYKNVDLSSVLKDVAAKAVISEVPLIKRAITYTQDEDLILKTDGINMAEMFKYNNLLDLNRLYTNDIHAMAKTYGIEAASRVIVKEVQNVFKVYGITVNPRHLLLIADYMTFDGTFKPLSRRGLESSASPLQQMSFESSMRFLKDATVSGKQENLDSPSSRLMVGQPCKSGTGAFSLVNSTDSDYLQKFMV